MDPLGHLVPGESFTGVAPKLLRVRTLSGRRRDDCLDALAPARVELDGGTTLATGSTEVARRWWQVALAAEIAGTMQAAFDLTLAYHKERRQFGVPIGSLQALQHRMSELYVRAQGTTWLAREAAFHGAPADRAAAAAAYGAGAAGITCTELHQMTGAIGFTREYDLHIRSLRLQALRLEMGGPKSAARSLGRQLASG